ncbi:MAG TPA: glycosyltransferase [Sporichthya sp.]|nr:glycosyltransferase [Sporichthya sp.]
MGLDGVTGVAVVIPAKDEQDRVATTVRAAAAIPGVDLVIVVDDGSGDRTAQTALAAGARVVAHDRNRGKAAAMETGAAAVAAADDPDDPRLLLFLDADLEDSAEAAAALVPPVRDGEADMAIAILPPQRTAGGGHGFVVRAARSGIARATGFTPTQPLSGQRCLTRPAFEAGRPLASGFGVETALTIDLLQAGLRVQEVECDLHHRVTGKDWRAQLHRLKQYLHVQRALRRRKR